jgi:hypothetical protein
LLRELVRIHVDGNDGEWFEPLLTRVPGTGEEISHEDRIYKVTRVMHYPVDDDGRPRFGWHAFVHGERIDETESRSPRNRNKTVKRNSLSGSKTAR